jgi:hypothetical protein
MNKAIVMLSLFLVQLVSVAHAEVKSIQCIHYLERSFITRFKQYPTCPTGDSGLGKPWMWKTYTFNANNDSISVPAEIKLVHCLGSTNVYLGTVEITPSYLIFQYKQEGLEYKEVFDRKTLSTTRPEIKCDVLKTDTQENKL